MAKKPIPYEELTEDGKLRYIRRMLNKTVKWNSEKEDFEHEFILCVIQAQELTWHYMQTSELDLQTAAGRVKFMNYWELNHWCHEYELTETVSQRFLDLFDKEGKRHQTEQEFYAEGRKKIQAGIDRMLAAHEG